MSDDFYKRLSLIAGLFALAAIFILTIFMANLEIKDLDIWLHLGMGQTIVTNGYVPDRDVLSCTIAGKPWVNHEWLFQILVYYCFKLAGPDGLITMQVIVVALTMLVLFFLGYNRENQLPCIFMLLLTFLVYKGRFTTRPDLFSLLFFSLYIFIMSFFLDRKWSLPVLFVIQVLWTNMHGFFFFGPLFVLIGIVAEWIKRHVPLPYEWNGVGRLTDDEFKRLKLIFLFVVAACLINPLGLEGAWYPLKVFFQISGEHKIFFEKIIELRKPITWATLFSPEEFPYYKLMILLSALSFVFNRWRIDIGVFLFWLVFLLFSLAAVRNLSFFAFAAYLVFVTNALTIRLQDLLPIEIEDKKFVHIVSLFLKVIIIIWVARYGEKISYNGYFDYENYQRKSEFGGVTLRSYPHRAVAFLVKNKIKGNIFNDFNSGAYLVGHCYPDLKVFIDGRTEVYGPEFFKYYQSIWEKNAPEEFQAMLDKYHITVALLNSVNQAIPKHTLKVLNESDDWAPVYFDYDAVIFLKKTPENLPVIERNRIDFAHWKPIKMDLYRLGAFKVSPYRNINRANTLMDLGDYGPAIGELVEARKINPEYAPIYEMMGLIYTKDDNYEKAFENFRIAAVLSKGRLKTRINLAKAYYDLNQYNYAVNQFDRITRRWPDNARAYFLLARTYMKMTKYDKGLSTVQKAFSLDKKAVGDVLAVGDIAYDAGEYGVAEKVYSLTLDVDEKGKTQLKLASVYEALGEKDKSRDMVEKGLQVNPSNEDLREKASALGLPLPAEPAAP